MDYEALALELSEPKYSTFRDDPVTCITIMQAENSEIYQAFAIARWSEAIQQRGTPQGVYVKNLNDKKDDPTLLADGRTLGQICTDVLDTISGNTLSNQIDYTDAEVRSNMDGILAELVTHEVFDLLLQSKLRDQGAVPSDTWIDLEEPNEGDILRAWELVPDAKTGGTR